MENTRNPTNLLSTDPGNLKREKIRTIPITLIDSANVHPFQVKEDDELRSLMESISQLGVITPCIARRKGEERYELISGHRRKRACELLGIDMLPIIIRELSETCVYARRIERVYGRQNQTTENERERSILFFAC